MTKDEILARQLVQTLEKVKKEKGILDKISRGQCEKHGDVECKKYGRLWRCVHCGRIVE